MPLPNDPGGQNPRRRRTQHRYFPDVGLADPMQWDAPAIDIAGLGTGTVADLPIPENCIMQVFADHYVAGDDAGGLDALQAFSAIVLRIADHTPTGQVKKATAIQSSGILNNGASTAVSVVAGGPTGFVLRIAQTASTHAMRVQARFKIGCVPYNGVAPP